MPTEPTRRQFLGAAAATAGALALPHRAQAAQRPDIVVILADDMGFSDIGCYGSEIRTPNLDRLAAGGLRFTQFCNTARCCPTRASLLTGLYPHQAGVGHMTGDSGFPAYRGDLNRRCVTIAEALGPSGYRTYMTGKWHVTKFTKPDGPRDNWPRQRGFDRYFGTLVGAGSYYTPNALYLDNDPITEFPEGFYYTRAIADHAATFIADHARDHASEPLFMYAAFTASHWPLHALREDRDRYRDRYRGGWDALRAERHQRMIQAGLVDERWRLTPRDEQVPAWDDLDQVRRNDLAARMAVYAGQIDALDQAIGTIVGALRAAGRLDNTLLLFLADNGGCAEGGPSGFERKPDGVLGEDSSFASYGQGWANASNTPFRLYKHWVHEGGIATPLIAHWPNRIMDHGQLRHQPGHVIDLMATCVDVAGTKYPTEQDGEAIQPMEGHSLAPAFANQPIRREAIYWEHEGNRAVKRGKWKLVSRHPGGWELYDLEVDRTELYNVIDEQAEVAAELQQLYAAWAERCGVRDWPVKQQAAAGSNQTSFTLGNGDELAPAESPRLKGRGVTITATLDGPANGVITAQGGTRVGLALYVQEGHLCLTVRARAGQPVLVKSADTLPAGELTVLAKLAPNGDLTLQVNGQTVATGKAETLTDQPTEGLSVGHDTGASVGEYQAPFGYQGKLGKVRVELVK